jgi:hypothetical protein
VGVEVGAKVRVGDGGDSNGVVDTPELGLLDPQDEQTNTAAHAATAASLN